MKRSLARVLVFALFATATSGAFAQADDATTKAARARFQEGVGLYDKGQYEAARAAFLQAYALRKHPAVLLNLAQTSLRSSRALEAAKYFQQYLRESTTATPAQKADAEKGLAEARQKLGRLEVSAATGAEISVDGNVVGAAPLSEAVDVEPGNHTVKARGSDGTSESKSVTVKAGEKLPVQLVHKNDPPVAAPVPVPTPAPTPPPAAAPPPTAPPTPTEPEKPAATTFDVQPTKKSFRPKTMVPVYVGAGVALVGAGTAVAFKIFREDALDSARRTAKLIESKGGNSQTCNNPETRFAQACQALKDDVDRSNTDTTVANIGIGVGVAGAAFALGWLFFGPKKDADAPEAAILRMPILSPMLGETRGLKLDARF